MVEQPMITFSDGNAIPQVGLGVYQTPNDGASAAVQAALNAGYRHIDTAAIYGNEEGVGKGVQTSNVAREDIFLTTKLWNDAQGYEATLMAFEESLKRLGTDYVDLYLIHWPAPKMDLYVETWKAFIQLQKEKRIKSIGVSNFNPDHIDRLVSETGVKPVINQIELHPDFQQTEFRAFHDSQNIVTESWSPLGQGKLMDNGVLVEIATKHGKTPAQVLIRWHIDMGLVTIPKSSNPERIKANFDVFDFKLDQDDLAALAKLDDTKNRLGPDPLTADF
ncbi:aldo/keto reductase [Roseibium sp. CAU 1637]|uniref:Aldo/keto reductase n=1 Tax=Roseibium limicola TaxID=2816037 RepID=A0A939EQ37_9HYPH|nr:aldo/keto reductase [Roseibium limicola]MBO0346453.1 aldo/keto reductase [Roseibium limicola]